MIKVLTVASHTNVKGLYDLQYSLEKNGWDYEFIITPWKGFGTKLIETYNYLKLHPEIDRFIFVDAYDVIALGTPDEFEEKLTTPDDMVLTLEKACWPDGSLAGEYPEAPYEWKYINSGTYYSPSKLFIDLIEEFTPEYSSDDQLWLTKAYLRSNKGKTMDYNCRLFQAYSFIADDDFAYENNRLVNLKTNNTPVFVHGNGRTDLTPILRLLGL